MSADTMTPPDEKDHQCLGCGEYPGECECLAAENAQDLKEYNADQKYDEYQDRRMGDGW